MKKLLGVEQLTPAQKKYQELLELMRFRSLMKAHMDMLCQGDALELIKMDPIASALLIGEARPRLDSLIDRVIAEEAPKYLTEDMVDHLLAFYRSPVGQKMLDVQPAMLQGIDTVAKAAMEKLFSEVEREQRATQARA
jgi:hypothetical protein